MNEHKANIQNGLEKLEMLRIKAMIENENDEDEDFDSQQNISP